MSEWQPIETAPKQAGQQFLVFDIMHSRNRVMLVQRGFVSGAIMTVPGQWSVVATHWMPLPEPPSEPRA